MQSRQRQPGARPKRLQNLGRIERRFLPALARRRAPADRMVRLPRRRKTLRRCRVAHGDRTHRRLRTRSPALQALQKKPQRTPGNHLRLPRQAAHGLESRSESEETKCLTWWELARKDFGWNGLPKAMPLASLTRAKNGAGIRGIAKPAASNPVIASTLWRMANCAAGRPLCASMWAATARATRLSGAAAQWLAR